MKTFRKIFAMLSPAERKSAIFVLGLTIVGAILETLGVGVVVPAIALLVGTDLSTKPRFAPWLERLGHPTQVQLAQDGMLALVAIYLVKTAYLVFLVWQQAKYSNTVQTNLSQRLFTIYLRQPYTFHLQRNSAELVHNISGEVGLLALALTNVMLLMTEGLALVAIGLLLLMVEPVGTLIVFVILGTAGWGFYRSIRTHIGRWGIARQQHGLSAGRHLMQGLGGVKEVILLGREDDFLAQYRLHHAELARVSYLQATMQQLPRLWLELLGLIGIVALVLTQLSRGVELRSIVPTLALFAAAAFRLMPSVNRMLGAVQALRYSLPSIEALSHEFALPAPEPRRTGIPMGLTNEIHIDGVTHIYRNTAVPALSDISLTIKRGETVGFIGPSGSGKSTLVDVVLGLLAPAAGKVTVDGRNVNTNMRGWQDQIGYVSQHIYLTDESLVRNVAFGIPLEQIDMTAVKRALRAAQLEEFIATLPKGMDTVVGERGVRLSGGQRQRIGIARALYHDPAVLVLDEATSALDGATERGVMQAVDAFRGSKTILIVAHRLSTVELCDRLFRLNHGRLVEQGTPADILHVPRVV